MKFEMKIKVRYIINWLKNYIIFLERVRKIINYIDLRWNRFFKLEKLIWFREFEILVWKEMSLWYVVVRL